MRVLVVEDERLLTDTIAEGLRRQAMAVGVAYDGDAALERLAVNEYDVVVLDRDLPIVSVTHGVALVSSTEGRGLEFFGAPTPGRNDDHNLQPLVSRFSAFSQLGMLYWRYGETRGS